MPVDDPNLRMALPQPPTHDDGAQVALNLFATGVLLLDKVGQVIALNHYVEELIGANDGLDVVAGRLQAAHSDEAIELRRLVHEAVTTGEGGAMLLSRPSDKRPITVVVASFRNTPTNYGRHSATAAMFVADPEFEVRGIAEALRSLYSLTHAEARLAEVLVNGHSLDQIADLLGITKETVRWQIKHVFAKTGTNRQADLIRLLLTTLAHLTVPA